MINADLRGSGMTSPRARDRMIARLEEQGITNRSVLEVMRDTPRHIFIEEALVSRAYADTALPIGYGQTISQPYIVARMTELLIEHGRPGKVLEIGTGSGYQTAILAQLAGKVYTVERIDPLQCRAIKCLLAMKQRNVYYKHSDGGWGWEEYAPYDAIMVAAAPAEIPQKLLEQMAVGAVMLIPVGRRGDQKLQRIVREEEGFKAEVVEAVSFVPFLSGRQ